MAVTSRFGTRWHAATCALILATATLEAAQAAEPISFEIASQPLVPALKAFAAQSKMQLLYEQDAVRHVTGNAVVGSFEKRDALQKLLQGTGLEIVFSADNAATIRTKSDTAAIEPARPRNIRLAQASEAQKVDPAAEPSARDAAESAPQTIDEIVVTAQRREERLEDVPISITVLSGDLLDQSTAQGVTQALNSVPGVITTAPIQGGTSQVAVRGVTAGAGFQNGSSPIAYYLDSVPFGLVKTALVPDANAYDLARVEVLRGPQGTLYGASAQNGVVRILTRDADVNEFGLKARTSVSATEHAGENYRGDLAVNVPLIEGKLAARAVVGYQDSSGWIDKPGREGANDAEVRTTRVKVNAQPTDNLSIGVSAWLSRSDFGAPDAGDENRRRSSPADESIATDYDVFGLRVGYELPAFSVALATGYIDYALDSNLDFLLPLAGVSGVLFTGMDSRVFSQEIILSSSGEGPWRWSIGGMYRDGEDRLVQRLFVLPAPIDFTDTSESFAVFGEVTRLFLDGRFEVTVGLRHFEDDVAQIENVRNTGVPTEPLYRASGTFDADSPRVVLTWHPADRSTIYASYSEGFRSGFNQNANVPVGLFTPVEADTLKNYELGTKLLTSGGGLSFDAAVYYIDWQNVQQTLTVDFGGVPIGALVNGDSASGIGLEFGIRARPVTGLELGVNFSWNDLAVDSALNSVAGSIPLFGEGDRLNFSSEYTAGASLDYVFPVGRQGYEARFSASASYASEQTYRNVLGAGIVVDLGEDQLIARTSFSLESPAHWVATLFVDNINNEQDPGVGLYHVPDWTQRARPRTVGLQLEYKFE